MAKTYIGGQAIIEGVMMKGPARIAAVARRPNGTLAVMVRPYSSVTRFFPLGLPFVRGVIFLFEMLAIGLKTLTWSANQQVSKKERITTKELSVTMMASFGLAALLFVGAPYAAAWLVARDASTVGFNLVEGLVRLLLFLGYIYAIGLFADVRRIYQYHGAEHMAVNCLESGKTLTVANCREFSTVHTRCGTSLLVYVLAISILIFSLVHTSHWLANLGLRLLLLPVVGGIGYELLRLSARYEDNGLLWVLSLPGRLVQRITTQKPDAKQIEVALLALKKAR